MRGHHDGTSGIRSLEKHNVGKQGRLACSGRPPKMADCGLAAARQVRKPSNTAEPELKSDRDDQLFWRAADGGGAPHRI